MRRIHVHGERLDLLAPLVARGASCLVYAIVLLASGCRAPGDARSGELVVTVMSWNVQGNVTLVGERPLSSGLATQIAIVAPDFVALQECAACDALAAQLPDRYRLVEVGEAGVAIAYDSLLWSVADSGELVLGDDDDGWGPRRARWARFRERAGKAVIDVYSTHFCVPVRSQGDRCTAARQREYAAVITSHLRDRDAPAIVGGDLNAFDGFERAAAVRHFVDNPARALIDAFQAARPGDSSATFAGNEFAPRGRIDYLLATAPVRVMAADLPAARGLSDHRPVVARLVFSRP